ncbi:conserved exported hypothetical protein [Vibrio coralliirubri]|uniref:Uncharacterized protein n=1 Tax=Vibrio coralliirubri TaxID=1516159 RepID=A0AA86XT78_9VIBR|nr:hypothetical protein [Vibrio coralliirubri]CDT87026.1 conserved exported hypothetical protein [Vibrio coralliirubri]
MVYRWLTIGVLIALTLGVSVIALNYDNSTQTQRIGHSAPPVDSGRSSDNHLSTGFEDQQVASQQSFESQSERIEAQMLSELETLNQDIADEKVRLDQDTVEAQSMEESPELVLARASVILSELESEGIVLNYDPTLLTPDAVSPTIQVIEQQVVDVETDLIDIEKRFNNLGNNKESL